MAITQQAMLIDFFWVFLIICIVAFFEIIRISKKDTKITKITDYDKLISVITPPGELEPILVKLVKDVKSILPSYDKESKVGKILKDLKTAIETHQEESYAYKKSVHLDEAPSAYNVIDVGKIEFKIKGFFALLKKQTTDDSYTNGLWLVVLVFGILAFVIKNN